MGSGEGDAIDYWRCSKHNLDIRSREDHLLHEENCGHFPAEEKVQDKEKAPS